MTIQIDSREKAKAIQKIINYFDARGVQYFTSKLFVGDYQSLDNPRTVIDRKQNLSELASNISTVPKKDEYGRIKRDADGYPLTEWKRFTGELQRAKDAGIHVIVLCEHGGAITSLDRVPLWNNPRLKKSPLTVDGRELFRKLTLISKMYDVEFEFCSKANTGRKIMELLEANKNG